jgi:hypothetical protein
VKDMLDRQCQCTVYLISYVLQDAIEHTQRQQPVNLILCSPHHCHSSPFTAQPTVLALQATGGSLSGKLQMTHGM